MRVLITGTNRGIGLALVARYLEAGAQVVATARSVPPADHPLQGLAKRSEGKVTILPLDVSKDESCIALDQALGGMPIDVLINNAGVGDEFSTPLGELNFSHMRDVLDINAIGPLRVARAAYRHLLQPGAKVINMTSLMGSIADNQSGGSYAYRMSKAALNAATKSLSIEWKPHGILAVVVHPGWVQTRMGGENAPTSVKDASAQLLALIEKLSLADTGKFLHAKGKELPW